MDFHNTPPGEYGRFEKILSQFLLKSLHVILDSRVPSIRPNGRSGNPSWGNQVNKSDKWFNLVLGDHPAALDNLKFWHRNVMEPMIIDIILVQEPLNHLSGRTSSSSSSGFGTMTETVIERWVVQYEYMRSIIPQTADASSYKKVYQKSIILLRSLYSMMRLLPAYRAFRKLSQSSKACDFDINYKVSSFCAPFSRAEEEVMKQYNFIPVDAQNGRLSISLKYRESLSDFNLETVALFPPQIITDYVGSPATDPLRAFPSTGNRVSGTFPLRGAHPSSTPFQRPHTWTSGIHRGAVVAHNQPFGGSPPTYHSSTDRYDISSSPTDVNSQRIQNYGVPSHQRRTSFDDYQLSPPFSPSPSPSPPTYLPGGNYMHSRLRSETAPVSIPHPIMSRTPRYISPNMSDPSRHSLPPPSPRSTKHESLSQESPSGIRSFRKSDMSRAGESSPGKANYSPGQKVSRDSRDDSGRFSGLLSSSGSPRVEFSRSSSRLSFQDDLDDIDFSCPFIVDDIDTSDSPSSPNLGEKKASEFSSQISTPRKSQDAAVGALVHMLRTAPPLRQDSSSCYSSHSTLKTPLEGNLSSASSGFFMHRKTSDALEELRAYKEMKELLLSKSGTLLVSKGKT